MKTLNIKSLRTVALTLLLTLSATSLYASIEVDGIYYNITSSTNMTCEVIINSSNSYSGSIVIPETVTYDGNTYSVVSIGDRAFYNCTGLTGITISNSVTNVGEYAFYGCTSLTEITLPQSLTSIKEYTFYGCESLTQISIPNSVTSIGECAFYGCTGLTEFTIPNGVTSIDYGTFSECTGLTEITIPNSVISIGTMAFSGCTGLNEITIPNSVTTLGSSAFSGCTGLTSVTIGNGVTSISKSTFGSCTALTNVTIGNSVTSIDQMAFYNCESLTEISIPNCVTSIAGYAFKDCAKLTDITIEDGTETLSFDTGYTAYTTYYTTFYSQDPFTGCPNITTLYLGRNISYSYDSKSNEYVSPFKMRTTLKTLTIGNSVTSIGSYAFYECSGLKEITFPNSVTSIGGDSFYKCTGLKSITIGNGVTSIGGYAFRGCTGLTELTIGNSVTSIGDKVFYDCTGLKEINSKNPTPPKIYSSDTFYNVDKNTCVVNVPTGSKDSYSNATYWSQFYIIYEVDFPDDSNGIDNVIADEDGVEIERADGALVVKGDNIPVYIYELNGTLLHHSVVKDEKRIDLPTGKLYIIKAGTKAFKVML